MYFLINLLGILVVVGVVFACSPNRRNVKWKSIGVLFVVELLITWFMLGTKIGTAIIDRFAAFFSWLIQCANDGTAFVFPSVMANENVDFFFSALLPIIFVVTFFDILSYFGILTWIIDKVGWVISKISGLPKLESFFSIQMMFLGNTEALAVIRQQLVVLKQHRLLTFGLMSMSSISGSIIGAYLTMVPATYVFAAIPLNCLNALLLASILHPVDVSKEEDVVYVPPKEEKKDFFSTISNSMLVGIRMVIVILAMVIGYVALTSAVNGILGFFIHGLTIQKIFSFIFSPFAFLLGLPKHDAMYVAKLMGIKLATNEFVAMMDLKTQLKSLPPHTVAVATTFLTSFANFSTVGMIYGTYNSILGEEKSVVIGKNVWKLLVSGMAVSLLSAMLVGLFVW
ncbi:nucleoside transporter C-terminal domain-containing protein [Fictibacillus enclensis]|uniref:Nucleoside permease n=1 Tax=Fictibacillus enclensis TaxID=1017270 RepID=A0A0V8J9C3_9BACL|nr:MULTISPECIES: nucleoside transporter C-terminal domain-containing protein [Fictibacillus]KSU83248.1 nucleoside permease [Fictibacillus enclensis]MDM5200534.1 nucleoside transporter C-terminal domain-containing protein [Fictibacillus enclensis]MDM5339898.1 nucleoside transporter C-terminal domain-containing protein [Fictibacillus enclensis]RXZ01993.1 NupC/NupG family nucleoside CNT transporter [Fictibacillus sp. S7]WHY71425.1 nucleoside transporter C-terminal domain-containing protein [Ficti